MNNSGHHSYTNNINIPGKDKIKNETVKVCIRVRPMLEHEDSEFWVMDGVNNTISTQNSMQGYKSNEFSRGDAYSAITGKDKDLKKAFMDSVYAPQSFAFDRIYDTDSTSQMIYKETCRDITKSVINGYNGTVFMYGQTTSGKTFTMLGTPNSPGLLPCALRDIFNMIQKESNPAAFNVLCSYIEIYNENLRDLLTEANNLKLIDDSKHGVTVVGAKRVKIKSFEDGISLKDYGEENRKYRETLINEYSSRSHTIFQVYIETDLSMCNTNENSEGIRYSCLNLVDLAGSERLTDYDSKTEAFGETGYINKSLFVLANVVNKLAEGKNTYIPYRDSKLTRLLSQALGGNSLTSIICTVSPAALNYYQTLSTLRFATRAKIVKTKAKVNEYMNEKGAIEFYKNEIKKLQEELKNKNGSNVNTDYMSMSENINSNFPAIELINYAKKTNESLSHELENYKEKYFSEKEKNDLIQNEISKLRSIQNSQNFHVSTDAFFADNFNPLNRSNFENLNYSTNNSNKSNKMKAPTFYPGNNFNIRSTNPMGNFSSNLMNSNYNSNNLLEQNSINYNQNSEGLFIENQLNRIISYVHDKKFFSQWCEEANKINTEYMQELSEIQTKNKRKLMETVFRYFQLVEDNTQPGFRFVSHPVNEEHNKNEKNISKEFHSTINNSQSENFKNFHSDRTRGTHGTRKELNKSSNESYNLFEEEDIINKINNKSIFDEINFVFKLYSHENKENNLRILKRTYEEKVETLEKKMDNFKSYIETFYRKQIKKTRNSHYDHVENINENSPIIMITSEHNEKLKILREVYQEKLKQLEQVK